MTRDERRMVDVSLQERLLEYSRLNIKRIAKIKTGKEVRDKYCDSPRMRPMSPNSVRSRVTAEIGAFLKTR